MESANVPLRSGKKKCANGNRLESKNGTKMETVGLYRRKAASLSSTCQMYRPAGLSTIQESWRTRPIRTRAVYSDSRINAKHNHENKNGGVLTTHMNLCKERKDGDTESKKEAICLLENQSKKIKQAKAIYLNTRFHTMRFESLRAKILRAHETKVKSDISQATNAINKRTEYNVTRLKELCGVRERFFNERKSRLNRTHVSLNAVEMPEVSRYAYGLPAEGREFDLLKNPDPEKAKKKYRQLWKRTMKKATNAINIVKTIGEKKEKGLTLPNIIVKKTARKKHSSDHVMPDIEKSHDEDGVQAKEVSKDMDDIFVVSPVSLSYDLDEDSPLESDIEYE